MKYITVFDDNEPILYLNGQPTANLTQIKKSLHLQEICEAEEYTENGQKYIRYIVKA